MKKLINDSLARNIYVKFQSKRLVYKSMSKHSLLPRSIRLKSKNILSNIFRQGKFNKVKNRCIITGRVRGTKKVLSISRVVLNKLSRLGLLPGFQKRTF